MKGLTAVLASLFILAPLFVPVKAAETFALNDIEEVHVQHLDERRNEIDCLASTIFYEARGEVTKGQIAVGLATINRVKDGRYPDTICGVVSQRGQFSWYPTKKIRSSGNSLFLETKTIATTLYDEYYIAETYDDFVHGATHFHTTRVNPQWRGKKLTAQIGSHLFFKVNG